MMVVPVMPAVMVVITMVMVVSGNGRRWGKGYSAIGSEDRCGHSYSREHGSE
jgi:hypothetical protein